MKKIAILGKDGQVGWELERVFSPLGEVYSFGHAELDLATPDKIRKTLRDIRPDIILNAAAYTAVDKAEEDYETALKINGEAPGILAEVASSLNALLVHYSTDYVFDGSTLKPYKELDVPNPLNAYGKSKRRGEEAIFEKGDRYLILRTSWVYSLRGKNFLNTMLNQAKLGKELNVINDQIGAPTWSRLIAEATALILATKQHPSGLYHLSCSGETSWYGFAEAIFNITNSKPSKLSSISSSQYPSKVSRPPYSVLSNEKIRNDFSIALPHWEKALRLCLS